MEDVQVQDVRLDYENVHNCSNVAVYGTLRRDRGNHGLLRNSVYVRTTTLLGYKLYVMSAHTFNTIPFIVKSDNPDDAVTVEVFTAGSLAWDVQIQHLDWLENHPDWYTRVPVDIDGVQTWVYVFEGDIAKQYLEDDDIQPVPSGDYCDPLGEEDGDAASTG